MSLQVVEKVYNPSSAQRQPLLTFKTWRHKYEKRSKSCRNLQKVLELVCRGACGDCRKLTIHTIEEFEEVVNKCEEVVDVDEEGGEHVQPARQRGDQLELQDSEDQQQPGEANPGWLCVPGFGYLYNMAPKFGLHLDLLTFARLYLDLDACT